MRLLQSLQAATMDTAAGAGHRRVVTLLLALAPCAARAQALAPAYLASSYFPAPHPAPAPELPAPPATLATPPGPGVFSSRRGRGQQLQPRFPSRPPAVVGAELNAVFDPAPAPSSASPTPPQLFSGDVHLPSPGPAGLVLLGGGLGPQGQQPAPSPAPPSEAAPPPAGVPAQVGPALPAVPGLEQGCGVRVVEECRQQYEMVCEETVARRLQERCQEVTTQTCEDTLTTEYEPACFQRIISHCTGVSRDQP